jgi:hypothetical protein
MTSKLELFNGALTHVGESELASLTENREPRRLLDGVWSRGAVLRCLEQGLWNFALRTVRLDASPSLEPDFGYQYAFDKPSDYVRTVGVYTDEYLRHPMTQYNDEQEYWFADIDVIYVQYVSDDVSYGLNYGGWPESFTNYVEHYLAYRIAPRLLQSDSAKEALKKDMMAALHDARSKDAMKEPAKFLPSSNWTRARHRGQDSSRYENGSR